MREYLQRKRLGPLGLVTDIGSFPAWKVDAFYILDCELDALSHKEAKKKARKK